MAPFIKRLDALLTTGREKTLLGNEASTAIMELARERERSHGLLSLTSVLGWLGGLVAICGAILMVSANWDDISDATKIGGLILMLGGCHGIGFRLSTPGRDMARTAEAFHFLGAGLFFADRGWLPRGEQMEFFNFGRNQRFDYAEWGISAFAWLTWFFLAIWCVGYGTRSGQKGYLNMGVLGVGLGVITLFFDLIGSLAATGAIFLLGGTALLATGWCLERWRRQLLLTMEQAR